MRLLALLSMTLLLVVPAAAQDASGDAERQPAAEPRAAEASGGEREETQRPNDARDEPAAEEGEGGSDAAARGARDSTAGARDEEQAADAVSASDAEPPDGPSDVGSDAAGDERQPPAIEPAGWSEGKTIGWVTFGSSLAVAIAGGILLAAGVDDVSSIENAPDGTPWENVAAAQDRAPILTGTGAALLGLGAVGAAVGAGLLATFGRDGTWLTVSVLPGELRVLGRF